MRPHGDRIQIRFSWKGQELRPTLDLKPTTPNLKHAARIRTQVMSDIRNGTLDLAQYFPEYRFMTRHQAGPTTHTFTQVKDVFLKWVATRQKHSSVWSLKCKITSFWEPKFGATNIRSIAYKDLSAHVADRVWGTNKTHNNYVSALREMFAYALDHEYIGENPALKLKFLSVQAPVHRPYSVEEARALIAQAHKTHGEVDGAYWHLAFLLGLRPGEQIALKWSDMNKMTGRLVVSRGRTVGADSDSTKTFVARHVELPPAALALLKTLKALTALRGEWVFADHLTGCQIDNSTVMQERWASLHKLAGVDYREPYQCRHSSVSWKLMAGENFMKVAKNHGHSTTTMLKTYAHWMESDCDQEEVARIRAFHGWKTGSSATREGDTHAVS